MAKAMLYDTPAIVSWIGKAFSYHVKLHSQIDDQNVQLAPCDLKTIAWEVSDHFLRLLQVSPYVVQRYTDVVFARSDYAL